MPQMEDMIRKLWKMKMLSKSMNVHLGLSIFVQNVSVMPSTPKDHVILHLQNAGISNCHILLLD